MIASNRIPQGSMARFRATFVGFDNEPATPQSATIYLVWDPADPAARTSVAMQPDGQGRWLATWDTTGIPLGIVSGHVRAVGAIPTAKNFSLEITGNPAVPA